MSTALCKSVAWMRPIASELPNLPKGSMMRVMVTPRSPRAIPLAKATKERARLAAAQADLAEQKLAFQQGRLLDADAVETKGSGILRTVRAGILALPSRCQQRLPHLMAHDVAEIDREVRGVLTELGG